MAKGEFTYTVDQNLQITNMSWERIFLNIDAQSAYSYPLTFSLARIKFYRERDYYDDIPDNIGSDDIRVERAVDGNDEDKYYSVQRSINILSELPISYESVDNNRYHFHINMSILDGDSFPQNGKWMLMAQSAENKNIIIASISFEFIYNLDSMDRIFPYGKSRYAYTVHFTKRAYDSDNIIPILNSIFMIENPEWSENLVVSERKTIKGRFKCRLKKLKLHMLQTLYLLLSHIYKKDGRNILLMSETKPYLWGNLKYIDARIKERGLDKTFNISYTFRIAVGQHNNSLSWFKTIKAIAKQDYIFVDDYVPIFGDLKLSPKTKLIQVWHAGEGFKAVGYGRFGQPSSPRPTGSCHKMYDYAITGSERLVKVYSEVFGIREEKILPLGMARLDGFLDEDIISAKKAEFYSKHPECKSKKLILFSPTFRGSGQKSANYNYLKLDMDAIYKFCGDEYIWAFKMHPFIKKEPPIEDKYADRIIDLSYYQNINDLYYVTDIMITDYSSAYYEFSLMKRPILFYTYDRVNYENLRGVHKSIKETAPGKVCDSFEELMAALENKDYELEKTIAFSDENFSNYDGHAADRIIDTLLLSEK